MRTQKVVFFKRSGFIAVALFYIVAATIKGR